MPPTTWERFTSFLQYAMQRHGALLGHLAKTAVRFLAIAVLFEVFLFNYNFWSSLGNEEVDMTDEIGLLQDSEGRYLLTEADHVIEFNDLNLKIKNLRVDFSDDQSARSIDLKILFTDEAHETYFDTTEYTAGIPERTVVTNNDKLEYIKLSTTGASEDLRIELVEDGVKYPVYVDGVYLNCVIPFSFSPWRCAFAFLIICLIYLFRPSSKVYSMRIGDFPRLSKCFILAFVCAEALIASAYLFLGSNMVGVATFFYNWGSWDGYSLINTFEVGGDNAQQYAYLAQAIADGQLYLEIDPPDWLVAMDNPYDDGARAELQKVTGESYLWDVVYYEGRYYVYFGIVPVLLFYLPFYLLTQASFPTAIGVWISGLAFILGCTALLDRFARYHFKRVSLGLYLLLQLPLIFCSGFLYLFKHPTFYSLPIMLGLAFCVWGLYFWMRGRDSGRPCLCYFAGSLCMALVLGCRPQLLVFSFLAFPLFWRRFITDRHILTKRGRLEFACLIAPYLIVGAGIMWYNAARFGSPFDFGSAYNLTTNDMTQRGWAIGRILPALYAFFVQTPNTIGTFPFIQACDFSTTYMGQTIRENTYGGLFATVPILWVLLFTGNAVKMRSTSRKSHTAAGILVVLIVSAFVVAIADAEMAGILQRYYADFSLLLLLAAVLVAFILNDNLDYEGRGLRAAGKVLPLLVFLGLAYQFCLCFAEESGWYSNVYAWAYQTVVHLFQFWA